MGQCRVSPCFYISQQKTTHLLSISLYLCHKTSTNSTNLRYFQRIIGKWVCNFISISSFSWSIQFERNKLTFGQLFSSKKKRFTKYKFIWFYYLCWKALQRNVVILTFYTRGFYILNCFGWERCTYLCNWTSKIFEKCISLMKSNIWSRI